jgi:hypothetical protein
VGLELAKMIEQHNGRFDAERFERITDDDAFRSIRRELERAREMFPDNATLFHALVSKIGDAARLWMELERHNALNRAGLMTVCMQIAALAVRIMVDTHEMAWHDKASATPERRAGE